MVPPSPWSRFIAWLHNVRWNLAMTILPGHHGHISVRFPGEYCEDCKVVV